ncbi:peptidylprolyl isomerase [Roseicyclus sp. F158]|uniref:Peptidyl-prolyl cis-trans isomerase n=1 Tax=Tropicimonas omnivorans TaxID=3075590 RepID=A0ABU3DJ97_9RHOB|nr:peptidylprolyl isomerase [Roseicyclus sp. F158]MDT0683778.1 peptidylprolyl isomerase [Roseicyclus sp. F158]
MRKALALTLALAAAPALAQEDGPGPNLVIDVAGETQGTVVIDLFEDVAPQHVERITTLAEDGSYDGIAFHRVIDGFMAQTGDVEFGGPDAPAGRAGTGGSDLPDLPAEFSDRPFERGTVGMARSASPDSANSQFFIMFAPAGHLDGQYTVVGQVIEGMDVVDAIRRGSGGNGAVSDPDRMESVTVSD